MFRNLVDQLVLRVVRGERDEVIQLDELHELRLTTNRKNEAFGCVWDCDGSLTGHVGYTGETREEAIEEAQKIVDRQY